MEVAGLAIGAVGIIALASTLKDTIDLLSLIAVSKSLGQDYEVLNTKLDIEKALMLQWATRVRLTSPDYDPRLDTPSVRKIIVRVLASIKRLLSDNSDLSKRYGISEAQGDETTALAPVISGPRMAMWANALDQETEQMEVRARRRQTGASVLRKVQWMARDREKFERLVEHLSYLVAKLDVIVPAGPGELATLAQEDIDAVLGTESLRLVQRASADADTEVAEAAEKTLIKKSAALILRTLWFPLIGARKDEVAPPHYKTLNWALDPPQTAGWTDLSCWLESGSGIYWLSGKAGSGKSTLMKHLIQQPRTRDLLQAWAGRSEIFIANHFFWNFGTAEQKSHGGLLRALLLSILSSHESIIPKALPKMWEAAYEQGSPQLELPSLVEMNEALRLVAKDVGTTKYCFFIDGLDEYEGDFRQAISLIKELTSSPNIKAVVSSRPIPECIQAFRDVPTLKLQELTEEDITCFVHDTLGADSNTSDLISSTEMDLILNEIIIKASGVFLWVVLACRSVLDGFTAVDRISELRRRVNELPRELNDMFQHMLGHVDARYRSQAAKLLRICHQNQRTTTTDRIRALGLALLDEENFDLTVPPTTCLKLMEVKERQTKCRTIDGRLRSRCGGLLELRSTNVYGDPCFCGNSHYDDSIDSTVEFMHRTVYEFLDCEETWELDMLKIEKGFDANVALTRLFLYQAYLVHGGINYFLSTLMPPQPIENSIMYAIYHGSKASKTSISILAPVLMQIEELLIELTAKLRNYSAFLTDLHKVTIQTDMEVQETPKVILLLAVEAGLVEFTRIYTMFNEVSLVKHGFFPLLFHAVQRPLLGKLGSTATKPYFSISADMMKLLFEAGCSPNEEFYGVFGEPTTPWRAWLRRMDYDSAISLAEKADITEVFTKYGAEFDKDSPEENDLRHSLARSLATRKKSEEWWSVPEKVDKLWCMMKDAQ